MKWSCWMLWLAAGALTLAGCVEKRKPAEPVPPARSPAAPAPAPAARPAPPTAAPAAQPPPASPAGYARTLTNAPQTAARTIDLATLNQAVQQFGAMEGRLPRRLEELVTMKYLPALPAPPRGQRLAYDPASGQVRVEPAP